MIRISWLYLYLWFVSRAKKIVGMKIERSLLVWFLVIKDQFRICSSISFLSAVLNRCRFLKIQVKPCFETSSSNYFFFFLR